MCPPKAMCPVLTDQARIQTKILYTIEQESTALSHETQRTNWNNDQRVKLKQCILIGYTVVFHSTEASTLRKIELCVSCTF